MNDKKYLVKHLKKAIAETDTTAAFTLVETWVLKDAGGLGE